MVTISRYAIIYNKGYQKTEEVVSTVTTRVEGIGYTNGSGIYENAGDRVWDSSDYVIPPQVDVYTDDMIYQQMFYCILLPLVAQQCIHHD